MVVDTQPLITLLLGSVFIVLFNAIVLTIFISSIDDFFLDCAYYIRRAYRHTVIAPRIQRATDTSLAALRKKQKAFAICIPAWDEKDVIEAMLERAVRDIRYDNYRLFVGVYANDGGTRRAIEALCKRNHDCAHRVVIVPHMAHGPTNKADCLNAIYAHVLGGAQSLDGDAWANSGNVAGFILHDAEDIVHPSELVVFNHLVERADIIQLPVVPLARRLTDLVGGHYQDEFAECHTKDMVVREALACGIPSAGVGCAFSARALKALAEARGGKPFDLRSVTEDYDVALDLNRMGFRSIFVRLPSLRGKRSFVATQEYFPNTVSSAVRQKSRWLLGIALESWTKRGWQGSLAERYMLWRDRKSILTAIASALAYILLAVFIIVLLLHTQEGPPPLTAQIAPQGGIIHALVLANMFFLANRIVQRFIYVHRSYGVAHALVSPLRIIVGNIINCAAAWRAAWLFYRSERTGRVSEWGKTQHQIPSTEDVIAQPGTR